LNSDTVGPILHIGLSQVSRCWAECRWRKAYYCEETVIIQI